MALFSDDAEAKKLAGWGQFETAEQFKDYLVSLACGVSAIEKPTTKAKDLVLALVYDMPYQAEFSDERILSHLKVLFHGSWAFNRADSVRTIIQNDETYRVAQKLIQMTIQSLGDSSSQLRTAKAIYDNSIAKEKADPDQSA